MKATGLQQLATRMAVKLLQAKNVLFIPVPVIDEAHAIELNQQSRKALIEIAKQDGTPAEIIKEMEARNTKKYGDVASAISKDVSKIAAAFAEAMSKADQNEADGRNDKGAATFNELDGAELYSLIEKLKADLQEAADPKNTESRAVVKLGFEDGIGIILTLTNRQATYESAQFAKYPTEGNCGNPDCPGCNSKPTAEAPTIH